MRSARLLPALVFAVASQAPASPIKRATHPGLSPDGSEIAFSWQGDVWVVPSAGGQATRLTVHPSRDDMPRWTPDGKRLVFVSDRYGNNDVFSMRRDGSDIRRLSFESSAEQITAVSPDGRFIYGYTSAWARSDLFRLPIQGGELIRLSSHPMERAYYPSISADGKTVVYNAGGSSGMWRNPHQSGSNTGEVWVADLAVPIANMRPITRNEWNDMFPLALPDGSIVFVSNRSGWPNLWSMRSDGSNPRQLTRHAVGTVRWPHASANGKRVVYEYDSAIWTLDLDTGQYQEVVIDVPDDQRTNPVATLTLDSGVSNYAVSPDGKRIVLELRGDLFVTSDRGGYTRRLTDDPSLDTQPLWLDKDTILFVSGRNGKLELFTTDIKGVVKPFASDVLDLSSPVLSPDGKTLAMHRGAFEIVTMPAKGGEPKVVATGMFIDGLRGGPLFSWGPDSDWIVYERQNYRGSTVVLHQLSTSREIVAARLARGGSTPRFLPSGKAIYFTAREYDKTDLFVVDLEPKSLTFAEDEFDKGAGSGAAPSPGGAGGPGGPGPRRRGSEAAEPVQVYEPGIEDRMRRLTIDGAFGAVAGPDSREIWAVVGGKLSSVSVATGRATPIAGYEGGGSDLKVSEPDRRLYLTNQGRLSYVSLSGPPAPPTPLSFSAEMTIDLKAEERALFRGIGWSMERFYYDDRLNGKDWKGIQARYEKLLPHVADREDFYALIDEMLEELDSSHIGATAPRSATAPSPDETGYLGIEWDWPRLSRSGEYVVASVMEGSPASHPQSLLKAGDRLLAVNSQRPTPDRPVAALLNRTAGKKTVLRIARDGKEIDVPMLPTSPAARNRHAYEAWVKWNRAEVERLSQGRLTYVHIEGMNQPSLELFKRQIRTLAIGKKGLVIDVRYNGGGSTAQEILNVLIKTPWLVRTWRGAPDVRISENIYRGDSLEAPSALLINQYSFSNAEIFAEGFRRLKIGPVIGERTAGGVIGTSSISLWDGGSIRMPAAGAYAIDGQNLERNGRKPDFPVAFDPNLWAQGRDPMLERAVQELLKKAG